MRLAHRRCIYSGSWDYSVRVWSRSRLTETALLSYDDWCAAVYSSQCFLQEAAWCWKRPCSGVVCALSVHPAHTAMSELG